VAEYERMTVCFESGNDRDDISCKTFSGKHPANCILQQGCIVRIFLMEERQYYVYFMASRSNSVLYVGVTNDLIRRVYEHKSHRIKGFSKRYNTDKLVYYEACEDVLGAIWREKQVKGLLRAKKNELVDAFNPNWDDLYKTLF
jgi:putative endonuclease